MLGAIIGDIAGSYYERHNWRSTDFQFYNALSTFTDDTVLTVALGESILTGQDYTSLLKSYFRRYPGVGFGGAFIQWALSSSDQPYNSFGNGSAMRVSPVGWAYDTIDAVLDQAAASAAITHNHPEGIKGAQAVAAAVFLARTGGRKGEIRSFCEDNFGYNLDQSLDWLRENYRFDVSCQGSVPQAIFVFLESADFEDAIRKAISIGGDSDTIASMAGAIAHAYYRMIPQEIVDGMWVRLDERLAETVREFVRVFKCD